MVVNSKLLFSSILALVLLVGGLIFEKKLMYEGLHAGLITHCQASWYNMASILVAVLTFMLWIVVARILD